MAMILGISIYSSIKLCDYLDELVQKKIEKEYNVDGSKK